MNERELLELAAKAAGYDVDYEACYLTFFRRDVVGRPIWNPLNDDGDALRMAVKLRITPSMASIDTSCQIYTQPPHLAPIFEPVGNDELAATRRAIVRAAAEIGKTM